MKKRLFSLSGLVLILGGLLVVLPSCGGGGNQGTGPGAATKYETAPGVVPPDQETSPPKAPR